MSIAFLNKKFDDLTAKEQQLNDYYDPVGRHTKQHRNIQDLREDYKEDVMNYGFSKAQIKLDLQMQRTVPDHKEEEQLIEDEDLEEEGVDSMIVPIIQHKNKRPMTAFISNQVSQSLRPTTAPNLLHQQVEQEEKVIDNQIIITNDSKFWRNTKKFDTALQSQIRNKSALQKIQLEDRRDKTINVQDQEIMNQQILELRINQGKLGQQPIVQIHEKERKKSPSDKDKFNAYVGFKESLMFLKQEKTTVTIKKQSIPNVIETQKLYTSTRKLQQTTQVFKSYEIIGDERTAMELLRQIQPLTIQESFQLINNQLHQQDIISCNKWGQLPTSDIIPLGFIAIEVHTMKIIHLKDLIINEDQLMQDDENPICFQSIMRLFQGQNNYNLFYFMIYQGIIKEKEQIVLLYEKFYYEGNLSFPISEQLQHSIASFYLRFLISQDPLTSKLQYLIDTSLIILQKKENFQNQMVRFINILFRRQIMIQDQQINASIINLSDMLSSVVLLDDPQYQIKYPINEQLNTIFQYQQQRASTATIQKPTSVQSIEKMSKFNSQNVSKTFAMRPQTAKTKTYETEIETEYASNFQPYASQKTRTLNGLQPVQSNFALALNFGEDNLINVLNLLQINTTKTKQSTGVFKTNSQGLRPSSAVKRLNTNQNTMRPSFSAKVSTQQKHFGEQHNLRFVKKIRGLTNQILIKGCKFNPAR